MNNLSAIIVAKGSPTHIFDSVISLENFALEIIIVDIGVERSIVERLKKLKKIRIVEMGEKVSYVELIREEIKTIAQYPYIFFLDPDEIVPEKLKELITANLHAYDYFMIPRKNIIFGRWIEHSRWWPDYQIRIFKKEKVIWSPILHKQPEASGRCFKTDPKEEYAIIHHNYETIDEYIEKATRYAKAEASSFVEAKQSLTLRNTGEKAISELVSRYFAGNGYKDGIHGLILAFLQMFYCFLVFFYFSEMKKFRVEETNESLRTQAEGFFKQGFKETLHWKKHKTLAEKIIKKAL